jgi:hypothetical protein
MRNLKNKLKQVQEKETALIEIQNSKIYRKHGYKPGLPRRCAPCNDGTCGLLRC